MNSPSNPRNPKNPQNPPSPLKNLKTIKNLKTLKTPKKPPSHPKHFTLFKIRPNLSIYLSKPFKTSPNPKTPKKLFIKSGLVLHRKLISVNPKGGPKEIRRREKGNRPGEVLRERHMEELEEKKREIRRIRGMLSVEKERNRKYLNDLYRTEDESMKEYRMKISKFLKSSDDILRDEITITTMENPVILPTGRSISEAVYDDLKRRNMRDPSDRSQSLGTKVKNIHLNNIIKEYSKFRDDVTRPNTGSQNQDIQFDDEIELDNVSLNGFWRKQNMILEEEHETMTQRLHNAQDKNTSLLQDKQNFEVSIASHQNTIRNKQELIERNREKYANLRLKFKRYRQRFPNTKDTFRKIYKKQNPPAEKPHCRKKSWNPCIKCAITKQKGGKKLDTSAQIYSQNLRIKSCIRCSKKKLLTKA